MKPYFKSGGITIYNGDCREILPSLPEVELLLTDPPYGIAADTDYTRFGTHRRTEREARAEGKPFVIGKTYAPVHGDDEPFDPSTWLNFPKVILFGANCFSERLPMGRWLIWDKRFASGKAFRADAECAWMGSKRNGKACGIYIYSETAQGFVRKEPAQHPTQKPVGLMEWCIRKSNTKGLILDPYMGSGTTLVAARNLNRQAIGIEIEEKYCEIAAKRLQAQALKIAA